MTRVQEEHFDLTSLIAILFMAIADALVIVGLLWLNHADLSVVQPAARMAPPNARAYELAWGNPDAPIQVIEYVNYRSEESILQAKKLDPKIVEAFAPTGKVHYEIRFLVDSEDETTQRIIHSVLCAKEQNRGFEMHYTVVENMQNILRYDELYSQERLLMMASTIDGMDIAEFKSCLEGKPHKHVLEKYRYIGDFKAKYVTPLFVINGERFRETLTVGEMVNIFERKIPGIQFLP